MSTTNWKEIVVYKPWGYEYLLYQNDAVAVWLLQLDAGGRTSMHCHPSKKTGLILLSGEAEVSFLTDSTTLKAPAKCMIRAGLFHSTEALSKEGVVLLELESPPDKEDLVRLEDVYGRKATPYEGKTMHVPRENVQGTLWLEDPPENLTASRYFLDQNTPPITLQWIRTRLDIDGFSDSTILAVLRGGLVAPTTPQPSYILMPGDVVSGKIAKRLIQDFTVVENTLVMVVEGADALA